MKKSQPVDSLWCNQKYIALVFGVSPATIGNMKDIPSEKQGRERLYYIPDCVQWFIGKELSKLSSLSEEQAKFTKTKRERQELALRKERGELVVAEDAKTYFTELGLHLKGQLEALPHRLSGRLAGMSETRSIALLLKGEMKSVLTSFRDMKLQ